MLLLVGMMVDAALALSFVVAALALRFFLNSAVFDALLGRFVFVREVRDSRLVLGLPLEVRVLAVDSRNEGVGVEATSQDPGQCVPGDLFIEGNGCDRELEGFASYRSPECRSR